jgi:hypothetical protein
MEHEVLEKIFDKLNALEVLVTKQACPSPGACVGLGDKLQSAILAHNATMLRVERLELELIKLNQQKAWLLGVWSAIAFIAGIIGSIGTLVVAKLLGK